MHFWDTKQAIKEMIEKFNSWNLSFGRTLKNRAKREVDTERKYLQHK